MTTQDPLEELRKLTSFKEATQQEQERNRNNFRHPITSATVTVDDFQTDIRYTPSGRELKEVIMSCSNVQVHRAITPYTSTEAQFRFLLPDKPNLHLELGQMVASANALNPDIDNLLQFKGRTITFEERIHTYRGRRRNDATGNWADADLETTYYHVTAVRGAGSNGTHAEPTKQGLDAALAFASGKTETEWKQGILQYLQGEGLLSGDEGRALQYAVVDNGFLRKYLEAGVLAKMTGDVMALA